MFKYQKIGEMDREYPFLFCSKSGFWLEYQMMGQNIFEKIKRQTPKMTFVFVLSQLLKLTFLFYLLDTLKNYKPYNHSQGILQEVWKDFW